MRVEPYDLDAAVDAGRLASTAADVADVCVSFNGGAWRGGFWLGVVEQLQEQYPEELLARWKFCGSSAGACYALALAMNFPADKLKKLLCVAAAKARSHTLGVAFRVKEITGQIILDMIQTVPEEELMRRLHGRFALCFTAYRHCTGHPYLVRNFASKAELFEATLGSSNIPLFSSLTYQPRLGGLRAYDGGLTPDGCVPLLPSRCIVYGRCVGEPEKPLPTGVSLDIIERPIVPTLKCFKTPKSDAEIDELVAKGRSLARVFFNSDEWKDRLHAATAHETHSGAKTRSTGAPQVGSNGATGAQHVTFTRHM